MGMRILDDNGVILVKQMHIEGYNTAAINAELVKCGYPEMTKQALYTHKISPEVKQAIRDANEEALETGKATRRDRILSMGAVAKGLETVIKERAESLAGRCAGGGTGLVVRTKKGVGAGLNAKIVTEYSVDTATITAYLAVLKQIAQETDGLVENHKVSVTLDGKSQAELDAMADEITARLAGTVTHADADPTGD